MKAWLLLIWFPLVLCSCSGNVIQTSVFADDFTQLSDSDLMIQEGENPAVYFSAKRAKIGDWTVVTSLREKGFQDAWTPGQEGGESFLSQNFRNLNAGNEPLSLITHPMIVSGDTLWKDFMIEAEFTPLDKFDKCGVVFAYQHPNDYFFFGTEGNTVILKHVQQPVTPLRPIERILAYRPLVWEPGQRMHAVLTVRRNTVSTVLNDSIRMYEGAELIRPGRIGLISDMPARFHRIEVKLLRGELRQLNRKQRLLERKLEIHTSAHPQLVRWKTIDVSGLGADQNLRLGDLNGDGNKELLFAASGSKREQIVCISALQLNGEMMWQYGNPRRIRPGNGPELPVQIHDLDGDLQREVLFAEPGSLVALNGTDGKVDRRRTLPQGFTPRSIVFADMMGTGRDNCLLLTDRESLLMVFNERLELLWEQEFEGGSQPLVLDMDGDGRDEVLIGYKAFGPEGRELFDAGTFIGDRCNGILPVSYGEEGDLEDAILYAAGDWGLVYVDYQGNILKQSVLGHVRYMSLAEFDMEDSGPELVTCNSWGSDGLIHILDARGTVTKHFMPLSGVSRCQPVNWKGDGEEFFILNADSIQGGLFDKKGELSVRLPSDGHPARLHYAADLYGDTRDELIFWDDRELWIYTQDNNPRMGKTYHPLRQPLYNHSFHGMSLSLENP